MNYKRVFVDGNVILDYFLKDRPFSKYSEKVIDYLVENDVNLLTSCDLITTVYYVLSKKDKTEAMLNIKDAAELFYIIPFSNEETKKAIELMERDKNFKDLEDTLQYVLAKENQCDLIISNDENFFSPDIKVVSTKELVETF
ncbi:MAG: type II toxin-antitoxin system VapC family toxin [Aquificae bacterium]|nr:type II toxin-antitoxin system VapC family toxin [Aquificota bacterium]